MELVKKYLRRSIRGVQISEIMESFDKAESSAFQNGFWIRDRYYNCVSKLFSPHHQKMSRMDGSCYTVMKKYGITHKNEGSWPSCRECFSQCVDKYLRDEMDI